MKSISGTRATSGDVKSSKGNASSMRRPQAPDPKGVKNIRRAGQPAK